MENSINDLVIDGAGQSFETKDFCSLIGPGVYVFLLNGIPTYVGMSRDNLLGRASSSRHHRWLTRKQCDQVKLFPCVNADAALKLENILISKFQPKYNIRKRAMAVKELLGMNKTSWMPLPVPSENT